MANMRRLSISVPDEIDAVVIRLKKTDEYCRCSYAEILRHLLYQGIDATRAEEKDAS